MKNILLIVQKLNGGGAERAIANLSKDLSKKFNVFLAVFDGSNIAYPYSGELIDLQLPPQKGKVNKVKNIIKRIKMIKKIKREKEIFCSISFMPGANLVNILSKKYDFVITSERNMMSMIIKSKISKFVIKKIAQYSDKTVALSNGVKEDLISNFRIKDSKIVTIYNSCEKKWFMRTSNKTEEIISQLNDKNKYIVTVGRLHYQKGQWHLLKAFKLIQHNIPEARLIILGVGELEYDLKCLANNLGIADKVKFYGYVKNHHKILEKCNVFVFPSLVEGLGNAILEAMACGLPIISTDCFSGPREIIAPNTEIINKISNYEECEFGILVPPFKMEGMDLNNLDISKEERIMAKAIEKVLVNEEIAKYYSKRSLNRINDFSSEKICKEWIELINEVSMKKKNKLRRK